MKKFIIAAIVLFASGLYVGKLYYSKTEVKIETRETTKTLTKIVQVERPDGTKETTTIIDSKSDTKQNSLQKTPTNASKTNISLLVANDFSSNLLKPIYGISVTKEVLGPFTIGAFGFTDGTLGVSVGFSF